MPRFSSKSKLKLETCHPKIQKIMEYAIKYVDFTVLEGVRTLARQKELVRQNKSKTLNSKHLPDENGQSRAIDVVPYPIDWNNRERFILFAGFILGIAQAMGIKLISGIDWDRDFYIKDHSFFDAPHFQLADEED
jgi:hypothetical protein